MEASLKTVVDAKKIGKLGVLYGGVSAEREVSLKSGAAVIAACRNLQLDVCAIDLQDNAVEQIQQANIDTAFIILHGGVGEDGRLQALLDFLGIAYTGSKTQASVLAMNKFIAKEIWQGIGLATSPFMALNEHTDFAKVIDTLGSVMVKPAHEGSSIGMSPAHNDEELKKAFVEAKKYDASVFAESLLTGEEYTVGILGDQVLPAIQLKTSHEFYDYEAKYHADDTQYLCPCDLDAQRLGLLNQKAKQAFDSLGCEGWGRVDLMLDSNGVFNVIEVNTVPGMTNQSLVPKAAKQAGLDFDGLIARILNGINRH